MRLVLAVFVLAQKMRIQHFNELPESYSVSFVGQLLLVLAQGYLSF